MRIYVGVVFYKESLNVVYFTIIFCFFSRKLNYSFCYFELCKHSTDQFWSYTITTYLRLVQMKELSTLGSLLIYKQINARVRKFRRY